MVKRILKKICLLMLALVVFGVIVAFVLYSNYISQKRSETELYSQYTFTVRIDRNLNVVDKDYKSDKVNQSEWVSNLATLTVSNIWINEYLNQFKGKYVPVSKALKSSEVLSEDVIDANAHTVLLSFSAKAYDTQSLYFSSWNGYVEDGVMKCEWVVDYDVEDLYDGTAVIHVGYVLKPEEYGIETYLSGLAKDKNKEENAENNKIYEYQISSNRAMVTFDGGKQWENVPVELSYLTYQDGSLEDKNADQVIKSDKYVINSQIAAFLYGGCTINGKQIPFTVTYTKDKGLNWVSTKISDISNVNYWYINFTTDMVGFVVAGYLNNGKEVSKVYKTEDAGDTWNEVGNTPIEQSILGAKFIDASTGFICYKYSDSVKNTLYATFDAGKTYLMVNFEPQELSDAAGLDISWNDVFVQANIPVIDSNGQLTVNVSQSNNVNYVNKTVVARYISEDNGRTWKYLDQIDSKKEK